MPSPYEALSASEDFKLLASVNESPLIRASATHQRLRRNDCIVSNQVLDVLYAGTGTHCSNRYVYVCLKEALQMDIEVPKHQDMLQRI